MATEMMNVTVPQGMSGGQALQVQTPQGAMQVTIPAGLQAGQTFQMAAPAAPAQQPQQQMAYAQPYPQQTQTIVQQAVVQPQTVIMQAPQPQVMHTGPAVQNDTGPVNIGFGGIAADIPGQAPVVQKGTEIRTIAVQSTPGCCFRSQFYPHWEAGKLSLTPEEFQSAVQEVNDAAAPCYCFVCCCCYCNKCKFQSKCQELNQKYAAKRVNFHIHTKYQLTMAVNRGHVRAGTRGKLNLVITQN